MYKRQIYAIPEGTVIFPREPMVKVVAPIMEAQLVETAILNIMNHQSLIATKAARVCYACLLYTSKLKKILEIKKSNCDE